MKAEDPEDKVRGLQRKLYAAAKRSRNRRFHALRDRIWRSDVLLEAGLVGDHPVTRGRTVEERVDKVVTFYGQSLISSTDFSPFLKLSASALDLVESGDRIPAGGRAQGQ